MTPTEPILLPKALAEPARKVGNWILAGATAVSFVAGLAGLVIPGLPPAWQDETVAVVSALTVGAGVTARVAAGLIRGQVVPFEKHVAEVNAARSAAIRQP